MSVQNADSPLRPKPKRSWTRRAVRGLRRRLGRFAKQCRQRISVDQSLPKGVVFVCGCQRAGTSVLLQLLDQSPESFIYGEGQRPVFRGMRLADEAIVKRTVRRNPARVVVIKPLCDSQWADRLLAQYERSRMLWAFRNYDDQVDSLTRKFSGHKVRLERIKNGDYEGLDWNVERLGDDSLRIIREYIHADSSRADAAAISWYIRTNLYFELHLDEHPQCQLLKYEDLVLHREATARRLFDFLGLPFRVEYANLLHAESVAKQATPVIRPEIRQLCDELFARINASYESSLANPAGQLADAASAHGGS